MGKHSCEACKKKCKKEAIFLQQKYYHVECFTCTACKKQLNMNDFYSKNGQHYCPEDYQRLFIVTVTCDICGEPAKDEIISVLGKSFHRDCFKCSGCSKFFQPGEKVMLSKGKFQCASCCEEVAEVKKEVMTTQNVEKTPSKGQGREDVQAVPNGSASPPLSNEANISSSSSAGYINKVGELKGTSKSLPKVFGMPDSRFYNISYLERADNNFRRGPTSSYQVKSQASTHYHRPENFSYNNFRKDFLPERMSYLEKMTFTRRSETQDSLLPIERDDWPGPPDPAAAYPELLREKDFSNAVIVNVECEAPKEIEELTRMSKDSGTAAVLLKDFQKRKSSSPPLDPRNASRTPSAAVEPSHKPRYETPFYASPSRHLDMLPQRSRSTDNSLLEKSPRDGITRPYTSLAIRSAHHVHYPYRAGSSMETKHDYPSSELVVDSRPESVADGSFSGRYSSMRVGEIDPDTGLRISRHNRASTLPIGIGGFSAFSKITGGSLMPAEPPKVYSYKELLEINSKPLPGVDREALESHLSKEEFQNVFSMDAQDFYHLPPWQRNEIRLKVGLK